jgi:hypothetical protein
MANGNSAKGNPASHRMSNANRKAKRAERWAKARKRRDLANQANAQREQANTAARAAGEMTPWERAKAARAQKRAAKSAA